VGHFASAGFKRIPPSVAESFEDLNLLSEFFSSLPAAPNAHELDEHLNAEQRSERYLRSFVETADKGLFSFDIETYPTPETCYFRVAIPREPLRFAELPERVREVLSRTALKNRSLQQCTKVSYLETLEM
jgi:hypothetical protein